MASEAIQGARAKLFINDVEIGHATGVNAVENQMLRRVDTLGTVYTREIAVLRRTAQFSAAVVRIKRGSAKGLGVMARGGTTNVISFPPMTAVLYDEVGDEPIETLTGCVLEQRSWNIDAAGLLSENVSFQAIKMRDEDEE